MERPVIVAASNKGPRRHPLSQAAALPLVAPLLVTEPSSPRTARKTRRRQQRAKRSGRRGRRRHQFHPAVHLSTIPTGWRRCWGACLSPKVLILNPVPGIAGSRCVDRIKNSWLYACFVYFPSLNNHTNCHREQKEISTTLQSVAACGSCQIYPTLDRPQAWHTTHYPLISARTKCRLWCNKKGQKSLGDNQMRYFLRKKLMDKSQKLLILVLLLPLTMGLNQSVRLL